MATTSPASGPEHRDARGRRRLSVDARYEQLLGVAAEVFAQHPYERAQIELIANRAGASPSLIYHYFPNKRALFAAVVERADDELGRMTEIPMDLPPLQRFRAGLDGYLTYVQRYEHAYRAMHHGHGSGDPAIQATIERNIRRQVDRITAGLALSRPAPPALDLALRGVLALITASCLDWLEHRQISREHLREMLVHAVLGAITGGLAADTRPATDDDLARALRSTQNTRQP